MQAERIPDTESRWIQLGLIAFVIVALLAVAIYMWGSRLTADTQQGARTSSAVAGVKAPRPVDRVLRGSAVAGVKAPRPVDRVLRGGAVAGVKAPRPVDQVLRGGAVAGVKAPRPVDRVLRGGGTA